MNTARLVSLVIGIGALLVLATPSAYGAIVINTVSQSIPTSGGQQQVDRLERVFPTATCQMPKPLVPGLVGSGLPYRYVSHTGSSLLNEPVCLTVEVTTACSGNNTIHSVGYLGTFNGNDVRAGYAADPHQVTANTTTSYSFTVPAGESFATVVHEVTSGEGCADYDLVWKSDGPWATARPFVSSTFPAVGVTINGANAAWVGGPALDRQWRRCDATGANCVDIAGATGASYTITDADLGSTLRFRSIAHDPDGTHSSDSAPIEPFIPLGTPGGGSIGAGDRAQNGTFPRNGLESRCGAPTSVPTVLNPGLIYLYDSYPVTSIVNEPSCLVFNTTSLICASGVTPAIYTPSFGGQPATNYAGNSGANPFSLSAVSVALQPGQTADAVAAGAGSGVPCAAYTYALGTTAPFATERPVVAGGAVEGSTLSVTDGAWSGTPSFARAWLRCDGAGDNCAPITGADGASYTPTGADVGRRVRARVTATQGGQSASADSAASDVVAATPVAAPGPGDGGGGSNGPPGGGPAPDTTAPTAKLAVSKSDLRKLVKGGSIPVAITCNEACSVTLEIAIAGKVAKKLELGKRTLKVATGKGRGTAARKFTLKAKLTRKAKKALKNARSLPISVKAIASDAAGNRRTATAKATLRRKR